MLSAQTASLCETDTSKSKNRLEQFMPYTFDDHSSIETVRRRDSRLLQISKIIVSAICALMLSLFAPLSISIPDANATELSDTQKELREVTGQVDEALDEYNAAQDEIAAYQEEIDALQAQIDDIEKSLEPYREQLGAIAKWQYTTGTESFMDMLFTEMSFGEWIEQSQQLEKISEKKAEAKAAIEESEKEIEEVKAEQVAAQQMSQEAAEEAKTIADENQSKADELEDRIDDLREEQREYLLGKGLEGGGPALDIPEEGDVVDYALSRIGCPYVWGASGPTSFDCSGLVMWAYKQAYGISLPHNSEAMYAAAKEIVPLSEAQLGDVLYRSGHVGICTKEGAKEYVHAPNSGSYVRINDNNSWSRFTCALRFV